MADKIKKIKIKQADGNFGDYIPLGADAANVDLTDGSNVETAIDNIKTQLEEPIEYTEINNTPDLTVYTKTENLSKVAISGDYNELDNTPDLTVYVKNNELASVAKTGNYNELNERPDLTVYTKTENLSKVAISNNYNDLDNKPEITNYKLPIATQTTLGGVKIDGSSITINDGVISAHTISLAPTIATSSSPGIVQPDNISILVNSEGIISVNSSGILLPTATVNNIGMVKPDGSTITITANGTISAQLGNTDEIKIMTGTYTGNGKSSRTIDIGVHPVFVQIYSRYDVILYTIWDDGDGGSFMMHFFDGTELYYDGEGGKNALSGTLLTSTGFKLTSDDYELNEYINKSGRAYGYIAFYK